MIGDTVIEVDNASGSVYMRDFIRHVWFAWKVEDTDLSPIERVRPPISLYCALCTVLKPAT